jgi:REP element-mobilizing transposase RayT
MSRLRRLVPSDRWFFITRRVSRRRRHLLESELATLAEVIAERRAEHSFLLTAWVFLPDHGHAIFYPRHPLTMSRVMAGWRRPFFAGLRRGNLRIHSIRSISNSERSSWK